MYRKLNLDRDKIDRCRQCAAHIIAPVLRYINHHSSVAIERATLRFLGLSGERDGVPLIDRFVEGLNRDQLRFGAASWLSRVMVATSSSPQEALEKAPGISLESVVGVSPEKGYEVIRELAKKGRAFLEENRRTKEQLERRFPNNRRPLKHCTIAVKERPLLSEVLALAKAGADIISLQGLPSTRASQCSEAGEHELRQVRSEVDRFSEEHGRYIRLCVEGDALMSPEYAVVVGRSRIDAQSQDALSAALFDSVNIKRALIDQHMARLVAARSGTMVVTRDAHLLTVVEPHRFGHLELVSHFLNEQFHSAALLPQELMALTHGFSLQASLEDGLLYEFASAQVMRELFPRCPIHFVPLQLSDIAGGAKVAHWSMALFHLVGLVSEHAIHSLEVVGFDRSESASMMREAEQLFHQVRTIGDELLINPNGKIARRSHTLIENALKLLQKIESMELLPALAKGLIAGIAVDEKGGNGFDEVFQKERGYFNPVLEALVQGEGEGEERTGPEVSTAARNEMPRARPSGRGRRRRGSRGRRQRKGQETRPPQQGEG